MSIIVAVRKNGRAVLAADTAQTEDGLLVPARYVTNHSKILTIGESYLGLAGWTAAQDIMESLVREHPEAFTLTDRAAIFETARRLHRLLKDEYYLATQEEKDQPVESSQLTALIVNAHGIFELESYRSVTEFERFWAIGSGKPLALGAMHALYGRLDDPELIARGGVEAACDLDDSCQPPIETRSVRLAGQADRTLVRGAQAATK